MIIAASPNTRITAAASRRAGERQIIGSTGFGAASGSRTAAVWARIAAIRSSARRFGTELSAARDIWQDRPLRIVGVAALSSAYQTALSMQGAVAATPDLDEVTLAGFRAAHKALATVE